jgi:hypothetical protein
MKFTAIEYGLDWDQSSNNILIVNTMCTDKNYKLAVGLIFMNFLSMNFYNHLSKERDDILRNSLKFSLIFITILMNIIIIVTIKLNFVKQSTNEPETQLSASEQTEENDSENGPIIDGKKCLIGMFNDNKRKYFKGCTKR